MNPSGSLSVESSAQHQIVDVTNQVVSLASELDNGVLLLNVPHTTAALLLCEDDEKLRRDFVRFAENLCESSRPFEHDRNDNPNAEAHLISALAGTQVVVPVADGRPALGTYQNVLFFELDGPKKRKIQWYVLSAS